MISLRYLLGLPVMLSLGACQSTVPIEIREAPAGSPPLSEAREKHAFEGVPVRWGGTIVSVKNRENDTLVEILGKPLDSDGEPVAADDPLGRFMVRVEGFLDPAIYRPSRDVTVYGSLEKPIERTVGERPYTFPVVRSQTLYLWEPDYYRRDTGPAVLFGIGVGFGFGN
ncbi:MAG: Slp family lipoprotein [Gammaproteobacteria bacterium]